VVGHPTNVLPNMRAYSTMRTTSDNSGAKDDDESILDHLRKHDNRDTISRIIGELRMPRPALKSALWNVKCRRLVSVSTGLCSVDVSSTQAVLKTDGGEQCRSISEEETMHLLGSSRRRDLLLYINEIASQDEEKTYLEVGDICDYMSAGELPPCELTNVSSRDRHRIYISLVQNHLEVLDDLDVIEYHDRVKKIAVGPNFQVVVDVLEFTRDRVHQTEVP